ncbi:MAG: N-acetyltransferase family protein [Burkholderiaceae bacterium]
MHHADASSTAPVQAPPPAPSSPLIIRPSTEADVPAIAHIYGHAVQNGTGTFETEVPSLEDMARRRDDVLAKRLPWLVAEKSHDILGYAYANPFRPRLAYRFCLEDSIYLDQSARGQGIGRLLLAELIARCEARGARRMLAVIGDGANSASIGVHAACGFEPCGRFDQAGWKFGRWLDVVLMQRPLGAGGTSAPVDV